MRKILLTILSTFIFIFSSQASHLYGGEIVINSLGAYSYELKVVTYIDAGGIAPPQTLNVNAYAKTNNALVQTWAVPVSSTDTVPQIGASCVNFLNYTTLIVTYSTTILLDSGYFDPAGYLFLYNSCCLTGTISNIVNPGSNGITLALDFPAVQQQGMLFTNSSPTWSPIFPDVACMGMVKTMVNQATDPDGDSLSYDFYAPFNGASPSGGSLSSVVFSPGYSASSPINSINLSSNSGDITMNPNALGTYAFGVKASEYRNGALIGASYRQYHMAVVNCLPNSAPESEFIAANPPGSTVSGNTITFSGVPAEIQFKNWDGAIVSPATEVLTYGADISGWTSGVYNFAQATQTLLNNSDTVINSMFFQPATFSSNMISVDILTQDNGCGLLTDTLHYDCFFIGYPRAGNPGSTTVNVTATGTVIDLTSELGGNPQTTGTWIDDDNTGGLNGNMLTVDNIPNGTYHFTYVVSALNYPNDSSFVNVTVSNLILGLNGINNSSSIKVYPNPSVGGINITIPSDAIGNSVLVYDVLGKMVFQSRAESQDISLDLHDLSKGIYLLKIEGNKIYQYRLILE